MFGQTNIESLCSITCSAQGPNVSSDVEALDFGQMTLLETRTTHFNLSNDSPIPATFTIYAVSIITYLFYYTHVKINFSSLKPNNLHASIDVLSSIKLVYNADPDYSQILYKI